MAVDNVQVNSSTGIDGNSYTTAISNDKLTNDDFLKLLLEEMKMQDPTSPMDSQRMMDSQLQMSTIESNLNMSNSMTALQTAFTQSALSNSANMIGHTVEDGSVNSEGVTNSYRVGSVESDGTDIFLVGYAMTAYDSETETATYSTTKTLINMNDVKKIN